MAETECGKIAPFRSRKVRNSCRSARPPTLSSSAADISGNCGLSEADEDGGRRPGCSGNNEPSGVCRGRSKSLNWAADATTDTDGRLDGRRGKCGIEFSSSSVLGEKTTWRLDEPRWPMTINTRQISHNSKTSTKFAIRFWAEKSQSGF